MRILIFALSFSFLVVSPCLAGADPNSPLELHSKGMEMTNRGRWKDAIKHYTAAVKLQPNNKTFKVNLANAHMQLGHILQKKGKSKQALEQYNKAMLLDPDNSVAKREANNIRRQSVNQTPPPSVE